MCGRSQGRRIRSSHLALAVRDWFLSSSGSCSAGHSKVDIVWRMMIQDVNQNFLMSGICQIQQGYRGQRICENMIHCKNSKAFIQETTRQRGLSTTDFNCKRLLVWNWSRKWLCCLSLLGVTAFMVRLGLMTSLLVAEMIPSLAAWACAGPC